MEEFKNNAVDMAVAHLSWIVDMADILMSLLLVALFYLTILGVAIFISCRTILLSLRALRLLKGVITNTKDKVPRARVHK